MNTEHSAFWPQLPGQGSPHFILKQALSEGQSSFIAHSGRQFGGIPRKFGMHAQDGEPFISLQIALSPQGFGKHGFLVTGISSAVIMKYVN